MTRAKKYGKLYFYLRACYALLMVNFFGRAGRLGDLWIRWHWLRFFNDARLELANRFARGRDGYFVGLANGSNNLCCAPQMRIILIWKKAETSIIPPLLGLDFSAKIITMGSINSLLTRRHYV